MAHLPTNAHVLDLGTTWTFGRAEPKKAAVERGHALGHVVFLEQTTDRGRRFGSYATVEAMQAALGTTNHHVYEIITDRCKPYFDVDATTDCLQPTLDTIVAGYRRLFDVALTSDQLLVSTATGTVGDHTKYSYHIVIDDGRHCASVKDARTLRDHLFTDAAHIDKAPYGTRQSFRLLHNSKLNSTRVLRPLDPRAVAYSAHMVTVIPSHGTSLAVPPLPRSQPAPPRMHAVRLPTARDQPVTPAHAPATDRDIDIYNIPSLLAHLPNDAPKQPFDVFFNVVCVCRNERQPFHVLDAWARRYSRYDAAKVERIWASVAPRADGFRVAKLQHYVAQCNPSLFQNRHARYIAQCIRPTIDLAAAGYDLVRYTDPYVRPLLDDISRTKHLHLRAPMGSGKTTRIVELIRHTNPASVLVVTPRQLFARSMLGALLPVLPDLVVYKDVFTTHRPEGYPFYPFLICQLESLHKLVDAHYDLVILDECESILYQFGAPTVKHFDWVTDAFTSLVCGAHHCLWSDAFLNDRSLLVCAALDPDTPRCLVWNDFVPRGRTAYHLGSGTSAKANLMRAAHQLSHERNVFVCASKDMALNLEAAMRETGETLLITADTSDDLKRRLQDVNALLQPYRHFIYTSALTVGKRHLTCSIHFPHGSNLPVALLSPSGLYQRVPLSPHVGGT